MILLPALILGFLGSFHCIGMCGPIVLALPGTGVSSWSFFRGRLLYNFGRIITYSLLGAIFGFLGNRIALFGLQQILSISLGAIIVLLVLLPSKTKSKLVSLNPISSFYNKLKLLFIPLFRKGSGFSLFTIGLLNGFLPCGFVYIGVAGAIAISSNGILNPILFMALFGAGTIPAMFGFSFLSSIVTINFRKKLFKLAPVFLLILGCIFVFRGLNLGIPYLSPRLQSIIQTQTEAPVCH